jgi:hypothetical protein
MKYYVGGSFWASFSIFGCNLEICHQLEISKISNMYNIKKIEIFFNYKYTSTVLMKKTYRVTET